MGKIPLGERRAGDVDVRPGHAVDELLQEEPADDRAGLATHVLQVRDRALQLLAILAHERELPEGLAGGPAGGEKPIDEGLIVAHDAGEETPEGDTAGTGERREIDERVRLGAGGERERV